MGVLHRDQVCGRAAVRPRVLRCQVRQRQAQSEWVFSLRQLSNQRWTLHHTCWAACHSVPWHVGIQVFIGYTGQVIVSALSWPFLGLPRDAEASLDVCDWWDGKEGVLECAYKDCRQKYGLLTGTNEMKHNIMKSTLWVLTELNFLQNLWWQCWIAIVSKSSERAPVKRACIYFSYLKFPVETVQGFPDGR